MSPPAANPRQAPIAAWIAQMVGTIVIALVVWAFVKGMDGPVFTSAYDFQRYMTAAIFIAAIPAIFYLRAFKSRLLADEAAVKARNGTPDPGARQALMKSISIGGALCELPMALGVLALLFGADTRWFVYATAITLLVRISYRPFTRS